MHPLLAAAALLVDRLWPALDGWRDRPFVARYLALMREQFGTLDGWGELVPVLFLVAVPVALASLLTAFAQALVVPLGALLGFALVLAALGPAGGLRVLEAYPTSLEQDDAPAAAQAAQRLLGAAPPAAVVERSRVVARAAPRVLLDRAVGIAFWALLAGPAGAVLWRAAGQVEIALLAGPAGQHREARRVVAVLAWAPLRAFAFTLALMGSSEEAFAEWRAFEPVPGADLFDSDQELLARVAHAALRVEAEEEDAGLHLAWSAVALAERAWLAWIALLVVLGALRVLA